MLLAALVERPGPVIRRLAGGGRARQMQFTRFLHNDAVTVGEMAGAAAQRTAQTVSGRDVLAIQDSSELVLGAARARAQGFGPIGRGGVLGGLLLHAVLAVDAASGALLGLAGLQVINRDGFRLSDHHVRGIEDKESLRWLEGAHTAAQCLGTAKRITVVADRESDIYQAFTNRPEGVHLIIRAAYNRRIAHDGATKALFDFAGTLPEAAQFEVPVPAAPGRSARTAVLAVRYAPVSLCKPKTGVQGDAPDTAGLTLVDIKEKAASAGVAPIHWRLLTTHAGEHPGAARMVLDFYRRRWIVEDYSRTLKTAGFDIEACGIEDPAAMQRFAAAAACAAVKVLQLVRARDGNTGQPLSDTFDPADQPLLEALSGKLEGKTLRQKNPHPKATLAFAAWVIARLGSWDGYYSKPGPKIMRIGLENFQMIKYGHTLGTKDV